MEENLFRSIPRVDELLGRDELKVSALPPVLLRESVREELDALRDEVRGGLSALPETGSTLRAHSGTCRGKAAADAALGHQRDRRDAAHEPWPRLPERARGERRGRGGERLFDA